MEAILIGLAVLAALAAAGLWYARRKLALPDVMIAYAKGAVEAARRDFQLELDYSEESIQHVETIVGRRHEEHVRKSAAADGGLDMFCKQWGAYIGEVVRKHHGGDWLIPADGPFPGTVCSECPGAATITFREGLQAHRQRRRG
jgi:hypothetical protein